MLRRRRSTDSRFAGIERFCLFVGHPRSGHSVLGTLLNAHRHAVVGHNLDALEHLLAGVGRSELFERILERDRSFAAEGRVMGRHSYAVPGQWHGHHDEIRVIGDKRAGATSRHLGRRPTLLRELPAVLGLPVVVIHHVRNPWDNVASIWQWEHTRQGRDLPEVAEAYFERSDAAARGLAEAASEVRVLRTFHEDLIRDPESQMRRLLDGLRLPFDESFLGACDRFVHREPRQSRFDVPWPEGLAARIAEHAQRCDFLARYRFDSGASAEAASPLRAGDGYAPMGSP
jgi:hypothetical protein